MARSVLIQILSALAAAAAVAFGIAALWLSTSLPPRTERLIAAVGAPVAVYRDDHGVPHIFAATPEDAALALGFVHAQDRLWQMEGMRRLAAGRLSEVLGPVTLDADRFMRTLNFARLADAQYETASPAVRGMLDAYARGVNRWRETHTGALPPEFIATGLTPEPWRPADSLLWLRTMSLRLAENRNEELLRERLSRLLPPDLLADLWPPAPPGDPLTIPGAATREDGDDGAGPDAAPGGGGAEPSGASNIWVVGGTRTKSGKPLLANDPHLSLGAPISWYLARIETPAGGLAGATAPGFPFFIFGHNDRIVWGLTSTGSDVEDLFVERPDPDDPGRYLTPLGSEPFAVREETVRVKGHDDVVVTVRSTRHGPVISDTRPQIRPETARLDGDGNADPDSEPEVLALAATYLADDDTTAETALGVNTAGSWPAFVAALSKQKIIQQNFGYADIDGNIGFIVPGRVPMREPGQGLVPAPGWSGEADWHGFIPFDALPRVFNPPADLIVNANNRIVEDDYPWYLGAGWDPGFRAQRIADLLTARSDHTVASMMAIQTDIVSLMAKTLLPLMLETVRIDDRHAAVLARLRSWSESAEMSADRPEPLIFSAWLRAFTRTIGEDRLSGLFGAYWGYRPLFVERVLRDRPVWCDRPLTPDVEDCAVRLGDALAAAMAELDAAYGGDWRNWRWDTAHEARFDNLLLGRVPLVRHLANVSTPIGGGNDTVMRAASVIGDAADPFTAVHGAGYRAVYDLADLSRSRFIIAPGQSGNPLSLHYRDLIGLWRDGRGITLGQSRAELEADATGRLTLVPVTNGQ